MPRYPSERGSTSLWDATDGAYVATVVSSGICWSAALAATPPHAPSNALTWYRFDQMARAGGALQSDSLKHDSDSEDNERAEGEKDLRMTPLHRRHCEHEHDDYHVEVLEPFS